jgi:LuxR family maltose regulon positive regulatory protein
VRCGGPRPAQVERLHRHTDGQPAGLRLAARALATASDVEGFLANFSGDERCVADYLVREVLSNLPSDIVHFLQVTSVDDAPTGGAGRRAG